MIFSFCHTVVSDFRIAKTKESTTELVIMRPFFKIAVIDMLKGWNAEMTWIFTPLDISVHDQSQGQVNTNHNNY